MKNGEAIRVLGSIGASRALMREESDAIVKGMEALRELDEDDNKGKEEKFRKEVRWWLRDLWNDCCGDPNPEIELGKARMFIYTVLFLEEKWEEKDDMSIKEAESL